MGKNLKVRYWTRRCKTKGCFGLCRPLSDYCIECRIKRKESHIENI